MTQLDNLKKTIEERITLYNEIKGHDVMIKCKIDELEQVLIDIHNEEKKS